MLEDRWEDGILVVQLGIRRLDAESADRLRDHLAQRLSTEVARAVVVNFENVEFMDSTGLGVLISTVRRLQDHSALRLCCLQEGVAGFLRLTSMDQVFSIFETEPDALNSGIGRVV